MVAAVEESWATGAASTQPGTAAVAAAGGQLQQQSGGESARPEGAQGPRLSRRNGSCCRAGVAATPARPVGPWTSPGWCPRA
ncbi:MAG: hypothetical protein ACK5PF_00710 [bacterium]